MTHRFFAIMADGKPLYSRYYRRRWEAEQDAHAMGDPMGLCVKTLEINPLRIGVAKRIAFKAMTYAIAPPEHGDLARWWAYPVLTHQFGGSKAWQRVKIVAYCEWDRDATEGLLPVREKSDRTSFHPIAFPNMRGDTKDRGLALFDSEKAYVVARVAGLPVLRHVVLP